METDKCSLGSLVPKCKDYGRVKISDSHDHSVTVFHRLRDFLKEGLLCDVTVRRGPSRTNIKAHRVVLLSAKTFDSDYNSDTSESDTEESSLPILACPDDSVFDEAYASDSECLQAKEHMDVINNMRLQGECCDVTLESSGYEFKAHKCVLAAASDYFKAMFTLQMKEECMKCIPLTGVSEDEGKILRDIFDYIYTGEMTLSEENIWQILSLSAYYQITTLTDLCQNFLIARVSKSNCCEMYSNAKQLALEGLKAEARQYIHDYFPEIRHDDVTLLDKADLEILLPSDALGRKSVPSKRNESRILLNVVSWLRHAEFQQSDILEQIRIPLISKSDFFQYLAQLDKFRTDANDLTEFERFVNEAVQYHEQISEQPLLQSKETELREDKDIWLCVDGVLAPTRVKLPPTCYHAKLPTDEQDVDKLSQKIRDPFHSVAMLNGFVYTMGGTRQTSVGYSDSVIRYDTRLDLWTTVASMNEPRGDFFACAIGDFLYVFGGKNKRGALQSCERYDPRTDKWERISDLPDEGLYMIAGVVCNGVVYISGGFTDYEAVGKTMKYTPDSDEWEVLPTMLFKDRGYHVMVDDNQGHIWAIGGVDSPFSVRNVWEVERFDLEYEMWEYVGQVLAVQPFLSAQRLNCLLDKQGNVCVFAVTNIDQSPMLRFDVSKNIWERLDQPVEYLDIEYNARE